MGAGPRPTRQLRLAGALAAEGPQGPSGLPFVSEAELCAVLQRAAALLGSRPSLFLAADPGAMTGVPEVEHLLHNTDLEPNGSVSSTTCPSVAIGTLLGQPVVLATTGIGEADAAMCTSELLQCGVEYREAVWLGTSGWSLQVSPPPQRPPRDLPWSSHPHGRQAREPLLCCLAACRGQEHTGSSMARSRHPPCGAERSPTPPRPPLLQLGGVLNAGDCLEANQSPEVVRLGDLCVSPLGAGWCFKDDGSGLQGLQASRRAPRAARPLRTSSDAQPAWWWMGALRTKPPARRHVAPISAPPPPNPAPPLLAAPPSTCASCRPSPMALATTSCLASARSPNRARRASSCRWSCRRPRGWRPTSPGVATRLPASLPACQQACLPACPSACLPA
jgi:hypothetical protein